MNCPWATNFAARRAALQLFFLFRHPQSMGERAAAEGAIVDPVIVVAAAGGHAKELFRVQVIQDSPIVDALLFPEKDGAAVHRPFQQITAVQEIPRSPESGIGFTTSSDE